MNDKLTMATEAVLRAQDLETLDHMNAEEVAKIAADTDIKEDEYDLLAGVIIYVKKRVVEQLSRTNSFEAAFPERCIYKGAEQGAYDTTLQVGDKLHKTTIGIKAKRLEHSSLYKKVYTLLQTGLYISYAVERMKVLDLSLDRIYDERTADRDRAVYMKLFLEETRKPENAKEMEVNFNLTQNNVSIASVEDKMNTIAQALSHASAAEVIDMVHMVKDEDDS